jgi:hypothetical protein
MYRCHVWLSRWLDLRSGSLPSCRDLCTTRGTSTQRKGLCLVVAASAQRWGVCHRGGEFHTAARVFAERDRPLHRSRTSILWAWILHIRKDLRTEGRASAQREGPLRGGRGLYTTGGMSVQRQGPLHSVAFAQWMRQHLSRSAGGNPFHTVGAAALFTQRAR